MTPPPDQDPENREDVSIGVAVFTFMVATAAVSLRIYTRKVVINQLGIDDYCAIIALLLIFGCDFAVAYNTNFGLGRHIWTVPTEWIPLYMRTFYVSIVMYNASLMAIKITLLCQYYRIFHNTTKTVKMAFAGVAAFIGCWALSQLLVAIFTCHPVDSYWNQSESAKCIPNHPFWEVNAAGNIVTDVLILILPIPLLHRLNLPRRQRHILIGIFSLGVFTVCISLIRIRFLKQYDDFTWENVESSGWSMGELASGLTCACLPTLRPLIGRYVPWLSSTAGTTPHNSRTRFAREKDSERGDTHGTGVGSFGTTTEIEAVAPAHRVGTGQPIRGPGGASGPLRLQSSPSFLSYFSRKSSRGVQRFDSGGDTSDGIVGLQATRDALGRENAKTPVGSVDHASARAGTGTRRPAIPRRTSSTRSRSSKESVRWMQPVVQADVRPPAALLSPSPPNDGS